MAKKTTKEQVTKHPIPTQDRVLVTRKKSEEVTKGGIIIPEMSLKDENKGFVVAVGPAVGTGDKSGTNSKGIPAPGDLVLFGEYAGTEIEYEGETYLLMRESDIMAVLP